MTKRLIPLLCALGLSGCALFDALFHSAFKDPVLDFKGLKLRDASLSSIGIDTHWRVTNPNTLGVTIAESDYQLSIEGHPIASGKPPDGLQIPADGFTDVTFPADVKFREIFPTVSTLLNKDTAQYEISGHIGLNTPLGVLKLPFTKSGTFEVPKAPRVALANPKVNGLSFSGASVSFPLTLTNKNSYPIPISNISGKLYIDDTEIADVSTGDLGELPPHGSKTVEMPVSISFLRAGDAVLNALHGGKANVRFDAKMRSGDVEEPLDLKEALQFLK